MKIVVMAVLWDVVFGLAMYLYMVLQWQTIKNRVQSNGWNLEYANPTMLRDAWHYFVPFKGIWLYLIAGSITQEMAFTNKKDCNGAITIRLLGFDATYREPVEFN